MISYLNQLAFSTLNINFKSTKFYSYKIILADFFICYFIHPLYRFHGWIMQIIYSLFKANKEVVFCLLNNCSPSSGHFKDCIYLSGENLVKGRIFIELAPTPSQLHAKMILTFLILNKKFPLSIYFYNFLCSQKWLLQITQDWKKTFS